MKTIFKMLGGSRAYHTNNEKSDTDIRAVFLNTEISKIIGLERFEHQDIKTEKEDFFGFELRHFISLLKKTNTTVLELLFAEEYLETTPEFEYIQSKKFELLDTEKFFKSVAGYLHNERRLTLGERTGTLGGKRRNTLEELGYSYKNLCQYMRLVCCAEIFFQEGFFPVNCEKFLNNNDFHLILTVKNYPETFQLAQAIQYLDGYERRFYNSFDNKKVNYNFNVDLANKIIYDLYMPILKEF